MIRELLDWLYWLWEDFTSPKRNVMPFMEEELVEWKSKRHTSGEWNRDIRVASSTPVIVRQSIMMSAAYAHALVLSRMMKRPGFPKLMPQLALVA